MKVIISMNSKIRIQKYNPNFLSKKKFVLYACGNSNMIEGVLNNSEKNFPSYEFSSVRRTFATAKPTTKHIKIYGFADLNCF